MKKSIAITREEWHDEYNEFNDWHDDVKRFLLDYFMEMCGSSPDIKIVGTLHDDPVAWVCDGYDGVPDCFVCVHWELNANDDPDILLETYVWDKDRRMSVTVA